MITTIFKKSTPINYILVTVLMIVFFLMYQFNIKTVSLTNLQLLEKTVLIGVLLASLFVLDFVTKKNGLSKDSGYTIFFGLLYFVFFPTVLDNFNGMFENISKLVSNQIPFAGLFLSPFISNVLKELKRQPTPLECLFQWLYPPTKLPHPESECVD